MEICLRQWSLARFSADTAVMAQVITAVREQPFADVCQSMLRQAHSPGAPLIFEDSPGLLDLLLNRDLRQALLG